MKVLLLIGQEGNTPLHMAVIRKQLGIAKILLNSKARKNSENCVWNKIIISLVVFFSFCKVCHVFLLKHSQPGNFTCFNITLFMVEKCFKTWQNFFLFHSQCSVRFADFCVSLYWFFKDGKTPYFYAESNKDEKMMELLNDIRKEEKG